MSTGTPLIKNLSNLQGQGHSKAKKTKKRHFFTLPQARFSKVRKKEFLWRAKAFRLPPSFPHSPKDGQPHKHCVFHTSHRVFHSPDQPFTSGKFPFFVNAVSSVFGKPSATKLSFFSSPFLPWWEEKYKKTAVFFQKRLFFEKSAPFGGLCG
jgi:hypothetical protein